VVCGDTGVGHLATAFGTPSVLLFGPTPPALWGPPASRPQHRVLHHGGRGDPHGATLDPALAAISVADVLREIDALEDAGAWRAAAAAGA
jgi:ADP-heptose:LPS heptosyltransferase